MEQQGPPAQRPPERPREPVLPTRGDFAAFWGAMRRRLGRRPQRSSSAGDGTGTQTAPSRREPVLPTRDDLADLGRALWGRFHRPPSLGPVRWYSGLLLVGIGLIIGIPLAWQTMTDTAAKWPAVLVPYANALVPLLLGLWMMGAGESVIFYTTLLAKWSFSLFGLLMAWAAIASTFAALLRKLVAPVATVFGGNGANAVIMPVAGGTAGLVLSGLLALWVLRRIHRRVERHAQITDAVIPAAATGGGDPQ